MLNTFCGSISKDSTNSHQANLKRQILASIARRFSTSSDTSAAELCQHHSRNIRTSTCQETSPRTPPLSRKRGSCARWRSADSGVWRTAEPPVTPRSPARWAAAARSSWPPELWVLCLLHFRRLWDWLASGLGSTWLAAPARCPTPAGIYRHPETWVWGSSWPSDSGRDPWAPRSPSHSSSAVSGSSEPHSACLHL